MSTLRAMDRAAKRAERQRIARLQVEQRQNLLDASATLVAELESALEAMTGAHRVAFSRRDWNTTGTRQLLPEPHRQDDLERAAEQAARDYRPGWLTRVLGREAKARQALKRKAQEARRQDAANHSTRLADTEAENARILAARQVMEREPDALIAALEEHSQVGKLPFAIEGLVVKFIGGRIVAVANGINMDSIPEQTASLLKSGKASVKTLPTSKRHEIHREAICSASVRVGIEFLGILPLEEVEVLMLTDLLDPGTGHIASRPVLHVRLSAQALQALNLQRAEASALVERLGGHLEWNKRDGFRAIDAAALGLDLSG